jgi:hypothetical protein
MTPKEACDYLLARFNIKRTPKTLANLACIGQGPRRIIRFGLTRYLPSDLDAWVERNTTIKAAFKK